MINAAGPAPARWRRWPFDFREPRRRFSLWAKRQWHPALTIDPKGCAFFSARCLFSSGVRPIMMGVAPEISNGFDIWQKGMAGFTGAGFLKALKFNRRGGD
ncbi:MAG: hypothetical protein CM15mP46_3250 [Alphaproteobacteria bacterium]|nr:MAG: hypothetical protein CM15mP46_3250 [Alphaproteobacteria bacterium]